MSNNLLSALALAYIYIYIYTIQLNKLTWTEQKSLCQSGTAQWATNESVRGTRVEHHFNDGMCIYYGISNSGGSNVIAGNVKHFR